MVLPNRKDVRRRIQEAAVRFASTLDPSRSFSTSELEEAGWAVLAELTLPDQYLGFTMVLLGNAFWKRQFLATPFDRRLLLLPNRLRHSSQCESASADSTIDSGACAACAVDSYRFQAEQLGYQILTTTGSPPVLKTIIDGQVDGILGIANLDELEQAIEKVLVTGVPSYAIPLDGNGSGMRLDDASVREVLDVYQPLNTVERGRYVSLMGTLNQLFDDDFERLLPRERSRTRQAAHSPLGTTEAIAYHWLANGGKRFRPFITLAAYQSLTGTMSHQISSNSHGDRNFPDSVCRVAMAIEAFHKASLVHDDIQDDDQFRYGQETLHRSQGVGFAINIGDYLIGTGYRLVNSCRDDLNPDVAADIVHSMANAHIRLCDGQGAEMAWQRDPDWSMKPADALQIYALKTSPAFEAALFAGLRMAGPVDAYALMIPSFAQHLGVGFQVLNDLKDWQGDSDNKLVAGQDTLAIRPTVLLALALDGATDAQREELQMLYESTGDNELRLSRLSDLFTELDAFRKAEAIVDASRQQAATLAASVEPAPLRQLLNFLVDTVLAPEPLHSEDISVSASRAVVESATAG